MEPRDEEEIRVVVTTMSDPGDAERLARSLVEERLAACVSVTPQVRSTYRWEDRIQTESEQMLWLKTTAARLPALRDRLLALHPYDVPELLVLTVTETSPDYLRWLVDATGATPGEPDVDRSRSPRDTDRSTQRGEDA